MEIGDFPLVLFVKSKGGQECGPGRQLFFIREPRPTL